MLGCARNVHVTHIKQFLWADDIRCKFWEWKFNCYSRPDFFGVGGSFLYFWMPFEMTVFVSSLICLFFLWNIWTAEIGDSIIFKGVVFSLTCAHRCWCLDMYVCLCTHSELVSCSRYVDRVLLLWSCLHIHRTRLGISSKLLQSQTDSQVFRQVIHCCISRCLYVARHKLHTTLIQTATSFIV